MLKSNSNPEKRKIVEKYGDFLRASIIKENIRFHETELFEKIKKDGEDRMYVNGINMDVTEFLLMDYFNIREGKEINRC